MMISVRRLGLLILVTSSVLLATGAPIDGARTLDTGGQAKSDATNATVASVVTDSAQAAISVKMAKLPLRFEANAGQWDPSVRFRARQGGASLFITDEGMTIGLRDVKSAPRKPGETPDEERAAREKAQKEAKSAAVSIKVVGAKASAPRGEEEIVTKSNFFIGNDRAKWRTNVANYAEVRAKNWLPGVDVVWHGGDSGLEYDLEVAAGVDARKIKLEVKGADSLRVNGEGALEIATAAGTLVQNPPRVVQDGRELDVRYRIDGQRRVGLEMKTYDPSSAVLVDPVLVYSTYLGGSGNDVGGGIAVDGSGNAYVTGYTSGGFPTTPGVYQTTYGGNSDDAYVTKLNAAGTALVYSTYLGGLGKDNGGGITVDGSGNAYVTGWTSGGFPTTAGAFQTTFGGGQDDAFITKLSATGNALIYSTYLGGSDFENGAGIAVDGSGNAYVTGTADGGSFPTTPGAYQTTYGGGYKYDAFITKLNASGATLVYSTYLGGSNVDYPQGIAVDGSGNAYVTGSTSGSFPTTPGAYQTTYGGGTYDVFVTKLNAAGTMLGYSTYLGGIGVDQGYGIAVDGSGNAYVTGPTTGTFPTTTGAFQTTYGGNYDAFVTKLNAVGTALVYSTYLGGSGSDYGYGIAVDGTGKAYVTGFTTGSYQTTTGAFQTTYGGGADDAFVTKLNDTGSALSYSTYLGGNDVEGGEGVTIGGSGTAYVTGVVTGSFPTTTGAYKTTFAPGFIAKFADPKSANGTSCTLAEDCASDLCVDGACCDTACTGQCQACDVTGHVGTCSPATGTPHGTRAKCEGTSTACGLCDGTDVSACSYPGVSKTCNSTCSGGAEIDTSCNGRGDCVVASSHSCGNFACTTDGLKCNSTCATAADCAEGQECLSGTCGIAGICTDDHTLKGVDGATQDCSPYKCITGACVSPCKSVDDCVSPNVCDPSGKCVSPPSSSSDSGGCSCDTSSSSNGSAPWGTAVLALSVASLIVRNRRRRAAR